MLKRYLALFRALNAARVKYLVIGGLAAIAYGIPRSTKDADIAVLPSEKTYTKLLKVFKALRLGTAYLTDPEKMMKSKITIFDDYIRVDVLSDAPGLDFQKCWENRNVFKIDGVRINFVSLDDLIHLKKAAGQQGDLQNVEVLKKIRDGTI